MISHEKKSHSDHSKWGENKETSSNVIETELDRMIIQAKDRTPLKIMALFHLELEQ